jgi:hypothetical protein
MAERDYKAALSYIEEGWSLTPLYTYNISGCTCSEGMNCYTPAKHPVLPAWQHEDNQAHTADEAEHVFRENNFNVGIVTGEQSGVFVIDVDPDKGGTDSWHRLCQDNTYTTNTRSHKTGSGGKHWFFRMPANQDISNSNKNIKDAGYPGIDVRGTGGFVVAPPSVTNKGDYVVLVDRVSNKPLAVEDAPEWLLELLLRPAVAKDSPTRDTVSDYDELPQDIQERANTYADMVVKAELQRFEDEYTYGEWDNLTNEVSFKLFMLANSPWNHLDLGVIDELLQDHCNTDSGFPMSRAMKCINSALNSVESKDLFRDLPDDLQSELNARQEAQAPVQQEPDELSVSHAGRTLKVTKASSIQMRRTKWVWKERIALGTLAIVAGPPGLGKSTMVYWLVAQLTNGTLYGEFDGEKKDVVICATEDSWECTIVPRLVAAGADLDHVFNLEIQTEEGMIEGLNLIQDRKMIEHVCAQHDVALMVLDPLMSRLGSMDTHKDAEVRQALEPLTQIAGALRFAIIGIMHNNKSARGDAVNAVMGSVGFGAVARSVHQVARDPDDSRLRIFGTVKNNLGKESGPNPGDLDSWAYSIDTIFFDSVDPEDPEPITTSMLVWEGDASMHIKEALSTNATADREAGKNRRATPKGNEASDWLDTLLHQRGGELRRVDAIQAGANDMLNKHSKNTLIRAVEDNPQRFRVFKKPDNARDTWWGLTQ